MQTKSYELLWALLLILFFTVIYVLFFLAFDTIPAAQSLFGHSLGLLGSLLVLMTESLYTMRKRSQSARWGRMAMWLQFHIITGLVGPFLILLHSSWQYNGLAGIVTLLMVVVVVSGFFGRYIYTAIPRTADGVELAEWELDERIHEIEGNISNWFADHPDVTRILEPELHTLVQTPEQMPGLLLSSAGFSQLRDRSRWRQIEAQMKPDLLVEFKQLRRIIHTRNLLERQKQSLALSRRIFSIWHSLHVPVGMALFASAAVHMGAALYYATLLH